MGENQEISKSSIAKYSWDSGHGFNFQNSKIILNVNSTSELDIRKKLAVYLKREVIVNNKSDSTILIAA